MPKNQPNAISITSVLKGKPIVADMYVRRFVFKDLPTDEEGLTKFLYKLYQEKDAVMEYYQTHNNTFPEGEAVNGFLLITIFFVRIIAVIINEGRHHNSDGMRKDL